jgi:hypothetical protein
MIPPDNLKQAINCFPHGDDSPLKIGMKWAYLTPGFFL